MTFSSPTRVIAVAALCAEARHVNWSPHTTGWEPAASSAAQHAARLLISTSIMISALDQLRRAQSLTRD